MAGVFEPEDDEDWLRFVYTVEALNGTVESLGWEVKEAPTQEALARFAVGRIFGVERWKRDARGEVLGKMPRSVLGGGWIRIRYCPRATGEVRWRRSEDSRHCMVLVGPLHESLQRSWLDNTFQVDSAFLVEDRPARPGRGGEGSGSVIRFRPGDGKSGRWCFYRDLYPVEGVLDLAPRQVEMLRRLSGPRSPDGGPPPPVPVGY